jgi:hypothetical protein
VIFSKIKPFLVIIFVINLIALDIFLFFFYRQFQTKIPNTPLKETKCSSDCTDLIQKTFFALPTLDCNCSTPTTTVKPTKTTTIPQKTKTISYIPITGNGNTLENNWVNLFGTEFYFNPDDYFNIKEAYFEANMKLLNGNGKAFLRLFDTTAGIEVWGSDVQTNSQTYTTIVSGNLTFRSGNHLYRVQAKSLTADTTFFNSGRIKLILEN